MIDKTYQSNRNKIDSITNLANISLKFIKRFIQINKNTNIVCDYISVELSLKILSIWNNYFRSIIEFHNNVTYSNNILLFSNKFVLLNSTISEMDKNKSDMSDDFKKDAQNDEIKSVVLKLFALIGFIIIIYSYLWES